MSRSSARGRRLMIEVGLLVAVGGFLGFIGPYGSAERPLARRLLYWLSAILGGGVVGISLDALLEGPIKGLWPRTALASLLMSPPVGALVLALGALLWPAQARPSPSLGYLLQVFAICGGVMAVRAAALRRPKTVVRTRTVSTVHAPEAEAAFRARLSARRRQARLIALEADDHYLKAHTDVGTELVSVKFSQALAELAGAAGLQVHRSWWVACDAIEAVDWRRGAGEARLVGGLSAPVSRSHAQAVRALGWR